MKTPKLYWDASDKTEVSRMRTIMFAAGEAKGGKRWKLLARHGRRIAAYRSRWSHPVTATDRAQAAHALAFAADMRRKHDGALAKLLINTARLHRLVGKNWEVLP